LCSALSQQLSPLCTVTLDCSQITCGITTSVLSATANLFIDFCAPSVTASIVFDGITLVSESLAAGAKYNFPVVQTLSFLKAYITATVTTLDYNAPNNQLELAISLGASVASFNYNLLTLPLITFPIQQPYCPAARSGLSKGEIVGIVIGAIIVGCIVLCVLCARLCARSKRQTVTINASQSASINYALFVDTPESANAMELGTTNSKH
jgi:hypothetical protein